MDWIKAIVKVVKSVVIIFYPPVVKCNIRPPTLADILQTVLFLLSRSWPSLHRRHSFTTYLVVSLFVTPAKRYCDPSCLFVYLLVGSFLC